MTDPLMPILDYPWLWFALTFFASALGIALVLWWTVERHIQAATAGRPTRLVSGRDRL